ncbi:SDR family NAD(P)-dependent oxidoreductase [Cohnella fermenti]|uniref:SDR family NAD(P)-dependent oxidoreductase n=1 Tax=Cohnella fermenti TaxID=2565925 RepID=A0A4S4BFR0_9BACL|nr:SDR family NAD(P)-dependent oxidoreductase [Cohnella fermenti]THF72958.1 SDR family NAD(P)-dependent oxidoreductase [Cohnella fermenti]
MQVAVVTGAGSAIGRAASLRLSETGFKVVAVDFNAATGEETLRLIREQGGEGLFVQADVSKEAGVERYVKAAMDTYGRIDAFFNNAGVLQKFTLLENLDISEFDRILNVTKAAAIEYVKKGVRVNAICPGGVDTALTQEVPAMMQESGYVPEEFPNMRIGRFADPTELAEMAV